MSQVRNLPFCLLQLCSKLSLVALLFMLQGFSCFAQNSDVQKLRANALSLQQELNSSLQDSVYINSLLNWGNAMRYRNLDSLQLLSQKALKHSVLVGYTTGEAKAYLGLGDYFSDRGNHEKGVFFYQKGLTAAGTINNTKVRLNAINGLAREYEFKSDYAKALEQLLEGLEVAKRIQHQGFLAKINENIALLYATQKDLDEALNYLQKVKKLYQDSNQEIAIAKTMSHMANIYVDKADYDYAMFNVNNSIALLENSSMKNHLAYAYEIKGKTYLRQNKYQWALYWFEQSKLLHEKRRDDSRSKITLYQGFAEAHLGLGRDSLSLAYARNAFDLSSKLGVTEGTKNAARTLYRLNKTHGNLNEALAYHELFQKLSDTLVQNKSNKKMLMLKTKIDHDKQKDTLVKEAEKAIAKQQNFVTVSLGVLLILIVILFLIKRSEKIQKNLNKELNAKRELLEKSESELLELNDTKNKLFSIIGHDLKGPIGAFQGIIDLFRKGEVKQREFLKFIPKLGADIDHISFTLNNLLSWGQAQMSGSATNPTATEVRNLVEDNFNLLSEIASAKSIKLTNQVGEHCVVWSDVNQIDVVVRNLISNALKFTPENGMISVGAVQENDFWKISIKDSGVGIPPEIKEKLFSKNDTVTTYGTNNEKGTGLGLMLCKEMVEKNKGSIWVESIVNKGTCFYFTVPVFSENTEAQTSSPIGSLTNSLT